MIMIMIIITEFNGVHVNLSTGRRAQALMA